MEATKSNNKDQTEKGTNGKKKKTTAKGKEKGLEWPGAIDAVIDEKEILAQSRLRLNGSGLLHPSIKRPSPEGPLQILCPPLSLPSPQNESPFRSWHRIDIGLYHKSSVFAIYLKHSMTLTLSQKEDTHRVLSKTHRESHGMSVTPASKNFQSKRSKRNS